MGEREMTMVEKVAREICITSGFVPDALDARTYGVNDSLRPQWANFVFQARAAIEAMREMTQDMIEGAYARDPLACDVDDKASVYPAIWRGAIDAALSETPTTPAKEP